MSLLECAAANVRSNVANWRRVHYPTHRATITGEASWHDVRADIVTKQPASQPFRYPSGLVEIPISPISDITAFPAHQWKLDQFPEAIRAAVTWTIEHRAVFDFLAHPPCLDVTDPKFRTIDLIGDLVQQSPDHAEFANLDRHVAESTKK